MRVVLPKSSNQLQESKLSFRDSLVYNLVNSLVFVTSSTFKSSLWSASTVLSFANYRKIGEMFSTFVLNGTLFTKFWKLRCPVLTMSREDSEGFVSSQSRSLSDKLLTTFAPENSFRGNLHSCFCYYSYFAGCSCLFNEHTCASYSNLDVKNRLQSDSIRHTLRIVRLYGRNLMFSRIL